MLTKGQQDTTWELFVCRSLRGDKLLLAVTCLGGSSVRSAGGSIVGISSAGAKVGLWRHGVPTRRLLGGHALGSIGIHLHVDLRRSLSGYQVNYSSSIEPSFQEDASGPKVRETSLRKFAWFRFANEHPPRYLQETVEVRDRADENPMPMLDGLHVDQCGDDMLPTPPRFQQADLRPRGLHLHARLGQHGRVHHHAVHPRVGTLGHYHRLHVFLHLLHDEASKVRRVDPRQGVRHCAVGKSEQPEPHHVVRLSDGFLCVMGTIRRTKDIRGR